jgi:hypothetical protein
MRPIRATALPTLILVGLLFAGAAGGGDKEKKVEAPKNASTDGGADKNAPRPNLLIIGASSLTSPVGLTQLVGAMLDSKGVQMNIEGRHPGAGPVSRMLSSKPVWDYVIMDAWHFGRGATDPPGFPKAVAAFVKPVRAHSPNCKIILFPWWIPDGPKATNEGVMEVFGRCVEEAKLNNIWVATTGPAFMEVRLARPDLRITQSKTDAHPGVHGAYINACSLYAVITGQSPVGLPATLSITATDGKKADFVIAPDDAKYLQEVAWKVYQREIKNTKPAK